MKIPIHFNLLFALFLSLAGCSTFHQVPIPGQLQEWSGELPPSLITDSAEKEAMIDKTIRFLESNSLSYWGTLTDQERSDYLALFDSLSSEIEGTCVSFENLDLDWVGLKENQRKQVVEARGHGEALGALTRLTYYLHEGHSMLLPERLIMGNNLQTGAPCISLSGFNIDLMGAWITPSEGNRLIISRVFDPSLPYSWERGDEIIALNGIPWQEWRDPLESSSLPIIGSAGANEDAVNMNWQKSLIRNFHLFTTVTVKRYSTGKTERIRILQKEFSIREAYKEAPFPVEYQPGTEIGKRYAPLEGGRLRDSNIGYIRILYFDQQIKNLDSWDPSRTRFYKEFRIAVASLMDTDGIILDLRHHGGGMHQVSYGGLELLVTNPEERRFYDVFEKTGPEEYRPFPLLEKPFPAQNPDSFFSGRIVVITGSECVSGGDLFTAIASECPEITVVGTANNGSFAGHMDDRVFQEGDIRVFAMIPRLIWYREGTENADLRKSFVDLYKEYNADDIAQGTDTLLNEAQDLIKN